MSNNGGIIKDSLLPPPSRTSKLLEGRKANNANLLKHTSSAPSLHAIISASSSKAKKSSPKTGGHLSKREKSFFNGNWIQSSSRRTSAGDSSAEDSSSSTTSSSASGLAISAPNVELLAKQVEKLENKLKDRNEKLETATERLSDRELEISILQKRLELRGGGKNPDKNCSSCVRKDGLISNLFEKVNLYESAILGTTETSEVQDWDLDHILRNVGELNKLVAENERSVEYNDNGAKFLPNHTLQLAFYADGLQLDDGRFRLYNEKATKAFMKDLTDGFFPSELQATFPNGVIFTVDDRRTTSATQRRKRLAGMDSLSPYKKSAFQGVGHRLESPAPAASLLPPLLPSKTLSSSSSSTEEKNGNNRRPISAPDNHIPEVKKSPKKKAAIVKTASSRDLHRDRDSKSKKATHVVTPSGAKSQADKCLLKVHGIGDAPFLMELVTYDTVKTVRSLLSNVLKSEYIKQNRCKHVNDNCPSPDHFKLYVGFPRRILNDDSKSLGDLGLVPNGVIWCCGGGGARA